MANTFYYRVNVEQTNLVNIFPCDEDSTFNDIGCNLIAGTKYSLFVIMDNLLKEVEAGMKSNLIYFTFFFLTSRGNIKS